MIETYSIPLTDLVRDFKLEVAYASQDYEAIRLTAESVSRPGLQIAGYFDYFEPMRLQILGNVEVSYLQKKTPQERSAIFDQLFSYKPPALLFARGFPVCQECLDMAKKHSITILRSQEATATLASNIITYLKSALAPRITRHGVLVEVYGEGLLLVGDSGVGKSETALELLKRGHRLIADDAVDIKRINRDNLVGSAPELIRYYMELRGIGVINVRHIYGVGAVKPETNIDLVVKLEPWQEGKAYDRLGLSEETETFLGVKLPLVTIPVQPGRNLAVILELAAMNNRQKKMGYNAAEALAAEHDYAVDAGLL